MKNRNKIICFGEPLVRFQALDTHFIDEQHQLNIYPGGSEANVAVRLASLGHQTSFVSLGPDNLIMKEYLSVLASKKVGIQDFKLKGDRLGTYFLLSPNGLTKGEVVYDRKYSSFSQLKHEDFDWDNLFEDCQLFHWTALTPALSESTAQVMKKILQKAEEKGVCISVDLNYRNKLWQYGKSPLEVMPKLVEYCDLILGNIWAESIMLGSPIEESLDIRTPSEKYLDLASEIAHHLFVQFPKAKLIGNTFRFSKNKNHNFLFGTAHSKQRNALSDLYETHELIDRIGSGDAFMAGVISSYLKGESELEMVNSGVWEAYKKLFIKGDF